MSRGLPPRRAPGTAWRRLPAGLRLALVLGAGLLACERPPPGDIVFVTVDTLRPDRVGLYGSSRDTTPGLDRWFGDAAIFENVWSTEANTSPSVVSLLTGLLPQQHGVRLLLQKVPGGLPLLPDLLPESYQTAAFVSNLVLSDQAMGIAARFDHFDDRMEEVVPGMFRELVERNAARTTDAALRWLASERDPLRPLFLWVHYIDPHSPYDPPERLLPPLSSAEREARLAAADRPPQQRPPAETLELMDAYEQEVAFLDAHVARLLDAYAERHDATSALFVLTADHGESMAEHEVWFTHGYQVYEEIVRVPLLMRGPGVKPGRHSMPVSGIDVARTMLAFAGVDLEANSRARDLRRAEAIDAGRLVFTEATMLGHWRAVVSGSGKWVVGMPRGERTVKQERFYDLGRDPAEEQPSSALPEGRPLAELRRLIAADPDPGGVPQELERGTYPRAPKVDPRADPQQLEMLRGLGYVEDPPGKSDGS